MFSRSFYFSVLIFFLPIAVDAEITNEVSTRYGDNSSVGRSFTHNGVKLYYEQYGAGTPLLIVHANGMSIQSLGGQIDLLSSQISSHRYG
jgi:hypothetical protein